MVCGWTAESLTDDASCITAALLACWRSACLRRQNGRQPSHTSPTVFSLRLQTAARQQLAVLRNIAEYQDMPLLRELAEWQLSGVAAAQRQRGGT